MKYAASQFLTYLIALIVLAGVASYILAKRNSLLPAVAENTREFNHPEDVNESWVGPAVGERIDLSHFKDEQGAQLSGGNW